MRLDDLAMAGEATVVSVGLAGAERRRLLDLGILPGSVIRAERRSPLGDPTAYRVRGSLIALRRAQANAIVVEQRSR